jgi:hypothetical protein
MPVTLPRNQLLLRYVAASPVHTVTVRCYGTVLRYGVTVRCYGTVLRYDVTVRGNVTNVYPASDVPRNFVRVGGEVQQILLRAEDRENGELGPIAP